jgi:hypothetical protein
MIIVATGQVARRMAEVMGFGAPLVRRQGFEPRTR